jgi:hypothetical protein
MQHIIHHYLSCVIDHKDQKMRATRICGEEKVEHILLCCHNDMFTKDSEQPSTAYYAKTLPTTLIDPEDLIGPSKLLDTQQCRPRTVKLTDDTLSELKDKMTRTKFLPSTDEDESEEIKILEYLSKDVDNDIVWKYPCIYSNLNLSGRDNPDSDGILDNQDEEMD